MSDDHVIDELASLVAGDLSRIETEAVVAHLRECDECRRHLVANVAASAALRSAVRNAPELFPVEAEAPVEPPAVVEAPVAAPAPKARVHRPWRWVAAAAAAAVVIGGAFFAGSRLTEPPTSQARAALHVVNPSANGGGEVVMRTREGKTNMLVTATGLQALSDDRFYEVWLFDPHSGKMLAVGVLGPGGKSTYSLPQSLISQYQVVDISLQQNNGNPSHSADSVLRARYAT